jgi:modulator of FtsH protease HflK
VLGRYTGKTAAGLNTNWPWPIGTVIKVPVWDQQITEVGYRTLGSNADIPEESQMLTGDKNIVDVHFRVNWQIDPAKPEDYDGMPARLRPIPRRARYRPAHGGDGG